MKKKIWLAVFLFFIVSAAAWGQSSCDLNRADMDCNGFLSPGDAARLLLVVYSPIGTLCDNPSTKGDLNCDGVRDGIDYQLILRRVLIGPSECYSCPPLPPTSPDPRDSIILESKVAYPSNGPLAMTLRVWITNKDTLRLVALSLREATLSGDAYATLAAVGAVETLTPTLVHYNLNLKYNSVSPDSLLIEAFRLGGVSPLEPPNSGRRALLDIKFDTVSGTSGQIVFDSLAAGGFFEHRIQFADKNWRRVPVNFVKGVVTVVACPAAKGDMTGIGGLTPADVVLMLNCVYLASGNCNPCFADVNCSGGATPLTPADVVIELQMVYLEMAPPC